METQHEAAFDPPLCRIGFRACPGAACGAHYADAAWRAANADDSAGRSTGAASRASVDEECAPRRAPPSRARARTTPGRCNTGARTAPRGARRPARRPRYAAAAAIADRTAR